MNDDLISLRLHRNCNLEKVSWNCLIEKVQVQVMMLQKIIDDAAWCGKNTLCLDGLIVRVSHFEFLWAWNTKLVLVLTKVTCKEVCFCRCSTLKTRTSCSLKSKILNPLILKVGLSWYDIIESLHTYKMRFSWFQDAKLWLTSPQVALQLLPHFSRREWSTRPCW